MKVSRTDQEKEFLKTGGVFLVRDDCSEAKSFISPTDSDDVRALKQRCVCAMRQTARGRVENECSAILAARIAHLRAVRQDKGGVWPVQERKAFIKEETKWLAPALLEAAEQGDLPEITRLLERRQRGGGAITNRGEYRTVTANMLLLAENNRPPLIGELLRQLGINKPRRTQDNQEEWERVDNRERVIRKTLRKFDLTLSEGKRGRRW